MKARQRHDRVAKAADRKMMTGLVKLRLRQLDECPHEIIRARLLPPDREHSAGRNLVVRDSRSGSGNQKGARKR